MTNLSTNPMTFAGQNTCDICGKLTSLFNQKVEISVKGEDNDQIVIRDGLWRGATLFFAEQDNEYKLNFVDYFIPNFAAKVLIFLTSVVVFSVLMTIILTAVAGEFVPGIFGVGGVAGFAMYSIIEKIFLANIKGSWEIELEKAVKHAEQSLNR